MKKLTLRDLRAMKAAGEYIAAATAYDYAGIRLAEEAQIDMLVPSDWEMGVTLLGYPSALQVTLEQVLLYLGAIARLAERAYILAPLPFGCYQAGTEDTIRNAATLIKAGADAIVLEGGGPVVERIRALVAMGIPCAGYLGYLPQQAGQFGGERIVGAAAGEAATLYQQACALSEAGAWGILLHNVPEAVARTIGVRTGLLTIGVGGTSGCDGYLVMTHDLLGWPQAQPPLFTAGSHEFFDRAVAALNRHVGEVQRLEFPTEAHTFAIPEDEFTAFLRAVGEE